MPCNLVFILFMLFRILFKGVVKLIYLYQQHKVNELTGHTVVGKPEQQLEAVPGERAAEA